jgi:hypothetical protein
MAPIKPKVTGRVTGTIDAYKNPAIHNAANAVKRIKEARINQAALHFQAKKERSPAKTRLKRKKPIPSILYRKFWVRIMFATVMCISEYGYRVSKTPEPEYGAIEVSCGAAGKLYVNHVFYDDVARGIFTIGDLDAGEYVPMIEYASGETEEKNIHVENGETCQVSFVQEPAGDTEPTPEPEAMTGGSTENQAGASWKPFLIGVNAFLSMPAGSPLEIANPFAGCGLTGEWKMFHMTRFFFSFAFTGGINYAGCNAGIGSGGSKLPFTGGANIRLRLRRCTR